MTRYSSCIENIDFLFAVVFKRNTSGVQMKLPINNAVSQKAVPFYCNTTSGFICIASYLVATDTDQVWIWHATNNQLISNSCLALREFGWQTAWCNHSHRFLFLPVSVLLPFIPTAPKQSNNNFLPDSSSSFEYLFLLHCLVSIMEKDHTS